MDPDDTRMMQPRSGARLALEALQKHWVSGEPRGHDLDGDRPFQASVRTAVDGGHAAAGQYGANPVAPIQQRADQAFVMRGPWPLHSPRMVRIPRAPRTAERLRLTGMAWWPL